MLYINGFQGIARTAFASHQQIIHEHIALAFLFHILFYFFKKKFSDKVVIQ